jgi:hypothetical protein
MFKIEIPELGEFWYIYLLHFESDIGKGALASAACPKPLKFRV